MKDEYKKHDNSSSRGFGSCMKQQKKVFFFPQVVCTEPEKADRERLHHSPASVTHPDGSEGECEGAKFFPGASPEWVAAAHAKTNYRRGISAESG